MGLSFPALDHLASLGDLHAWREARQSASRQAVADQLALNRLRAEELTRQAMDAETRRILEEAEAWLKSQARQ